MDPGSVFGRLFSGCIRDEYVNEDRGAMLEGLAFVLLGACASLLTSYLLSMAGIFV